MRKENVNPKKTSIKVTFKAAKLQELCEYIRHTGIRYLHPESFIVREEEEGEEEQIDDRTNLHLFARFSEGRYLNTITKDFQTVFGPGEPLILTELYNFKTERRQSSVHAASTELLHIACGKNPKAHKGIYIPACEPDSPPSPEMAKKTVSEEAAVHINCGRGDGCVAVVERCVKDFCQQELEDIKKHPELSSKLFKFVSQFEMLEHIENKFEEFKLSMLRVLNDRYKQDFTVLNRTMKFESSRHQQEIPFIKREEELQSSTPLIEGSSEREGMSEIAKLKNRICILERDIQELRGIKQEVTSRDRISKLRVDDGAEKETLLQKGRREIITKKLKIQ